MRLRSSLLLLAAVTAAPLLVVAIAGAVYVFHSENSAFVNAALTRNRATLQAVDAELRGTVGALRTLATSGAIERGDFAAFHREARVALASQPEWQNIVLQKPDGSQLVNARLPWGSALLQSPVETRSLRIAVSEGRPAFSDITFAPLLGNEPGVAVRLPVRRGADVVYVFTVVVGPTIFQQILEEQRLPMNWISGIVGTDGRMIARVPSVPAGTLASAGFRDAVSKSQEGWYRGATIEGRDVYTAYSRSELTGWSVGFAMPAEAIVGGPWRAAGFFAAGLLISLISALLIAYWVTRRIALPIAELARGARQLGMGNPAKEVNSAIEEVSTLARALREADVTIAERDGELRRRGDELARQAEELKQGDLNKSRFLALASHELRGPLGSLRSGLHILEKTDDLRDRSQARAMMNRQLTLLERLVGDLVDVGRISRGELELRLETVALDELVETSVDAVKKQFEQKRQSLLVLPSGPSQLVTGDADRLRQVALNLLTNANRYTPEGGHITVAVSQVGAEAMLMVSDNGVGLSPADFSRIFDLFVRLSPPGGGPVGSLGIGLSVTKAIVEMHQGRIEVTSPGLGQGTTFKVYLPACRSAQEPKASDAAQLE